MTASIIEERGTVTFPEHTGERVYMIPFRKETGLDDSLARWQATVDQMLDGIDTDREMFLMIDQSIVPETGFQRRPGVHVDGWWITDSGHNTPQPYYPRHSSQPYYPAQRPGTHNAYPKGIDYPESIVLASDVTGARAYVGDYDELPAEGGDCAHMDLSGLDLVVLQSDRVWAGNAMLLHESLPLTPGSLRTLVRINVPGYDMENVA